MFSKYFGHYLLNKDMVTPGQLADVLDFLDSVHIKLGVLAMNAGLLTSIQIKEIQLAQSKIDKKFGELAVEMGFLNAGQVEDLLATQEKGHLLLGQALLDKGYLSLEQLEAALNEYVEEYNISERGLRALEKGDIDGIVSIFVDFGDAPSKPVYTDYLSLLLRSVIRFIDDFPRLETYYVAKEFSAPWMICQEIKGPINLFTGIAGDEKVLTELAGKFAQRSFTEFDALAQSSISEFLNLHNGIFLVNMSNNGVELEMEPQEIKEQPRLADLEKGYVIPIYLSGSRFDLILSQTPPVFLTS